MIETGASCFDFHTHPDVVVMRMMPLKKRWMRDEDTGEAIRLKDFRTFPIRRDEPLTRHVEEWVSGCSIDPPFGVSRNTAFLMIRGIGSRLGREPIPNTLRKDKTRPLYSSELAPHIFRVERASQLAEDYGFDVFSLNQFFGWKPKRTSMAEKYAGMGWRGLARAMGVEV